MVHYLEDVMEVSNLPLPRPLTLCLQLKKKLQLLTLAIGGIGVVSAYVSYTPEIAAR